MGKTYKVGQSAKGRPTLILHSAKMDIPFSLFRDLGRICGKSWDEGDTMVFECLLPDKLSEAEKVLYLTGWDKVEAFGQADEGMDPGMVSYLGCL